VNMTETREAYTPKRAVAAELGISIIALDRRIRRAEKKFPELAPRRLHGLVNRWDLLALFDAVANARPSRRRALALALNANN